MASTSDASARPTARERQVEALVAECLDLIAGDEEIEDVVEQACAEHEQLIPEVRAALTLLESLEIGALGGAPAVVEGHELVAPLGQGAMGVVWDARDPDGQRVALKIMHGVPGSSSRRRFRRELDMALRLDHPNIVRVLGGDTEGAVPHLVMECIEGASLDVVLAALASGECERSGPGLRKFLRSLVGDHGSSDDRGHPCFSGSWTSVSTHIAAQLAAALEHAHARGVLHRDVKPSNVLLSYDGRVLLSDFGLARWHADSRLTQSGAVLGSEPYMSPEQLADSSKVDERSDVFSLGVTLYELLAGALPYRHGSGPALRIAIDRGQRIPIRARDPDVPKPLARLISNALEVNPRLRVPSARALSDDLRAVRQGRRLTTRGPGLWLRALRSARKRPLATSAVVVTVLGALLAIWLQMPRMTVEQIEMTMDVYEARLEALPPLGQDLTHVLKLVKLLAPLVDEHDDVGLDFRWACLQGLARYAAGQAFGSYSMYRRALNEFAVSTNSDAARGAARGLANALLLIGRNVNAYEHAVQLLQELDDEARDGLPVDPTKELATLDLAIRAALAVRELGEASEHIARIDGLSGANTDKARQHIHEARLAELLGDRAGAEAGFRAAIDRWRANERGELHAEAAAARASLGRLLAADGRADEALVLTEEARAAFELQPRHMLRLHVLESHAALLLERGEADRAIAITAELSAAIEAIKHHNPERAAKPMLAQDAAALILEMRAAMAQGRFDDALGHWIESQDLDFEHEDRDAPYLSMRLLALRMEIDQGRGETARARQWAEEALAVIEDEVRRLAKGTRPGWKFASASLEDLAARAHHVLADLGQPGAHAAADAARARAEAWRESARAEVDR